MIQRLVYVLVLLTTLASVRNARAESAPESAFDHELTDITSKLEGDTLKPEDLHAFFAKYVPMEGAPLNNPVAQNKEDWNKLLLFAKEHADTLDSDPIRTEPDSPTAPASEPA